ncbi:MAG: thiol-disulfide oxidoreductase DCC family protein [Fimbriimonadales bacterium]|nr:thiol-disulfide oxidoreductase DCC family protein [Fimbriimonadales bacterium]
MHSSDLIVLFDGECNLCNRTVQFIIKRDPKARFRFGALQWAASRSLLGDPAPNSTVVLIENDRVYRESAATLRICRHLRFPWPLLSIFIFVPRPIRDAIYRWIANNRYRWFGKRNECMAPTAELAHRFLTNDEI